MEYFLAHFMRPALPNTKVRKGHYKKKKNNSPTSLMNIDTEILNKILSTEPNSMLNTLYTIIKWNLSQKCKIVKEKIVKKKKHTHTIISIDGAKAFDKI